MIQRASDMASLPKKLKQDAIVEALFEIRFEHQSIAEVVLGQLVSATAWSGYRTVRLPLAELPSSIRESDTNLRFQPVIQLQRPTPGEIIKIGPNMASIHVLSPYPGWSSFNQRIETLISAIYKAVTSPYIARSSLRYVNALTAVHGMRGFSDLNFKFEVDGSQPSNELMASYRFGARPQIRGQVSIASPSHVAGAVPPGTVAFVDVEMSTASPLGHITHDNLTAWVQEAHDAEKEAFFVLWPEEKLNALREQ